jgi:hypothetical protein
MPINTTILNTNESHSTLITINVAAQTPLKLTSTNYLAWKLQFQTLFIGHLIEVSTNIETPQFFMIKSKGLVLWCLWRW